MIRRGHKKRRLTPELAHQALLDGQCMFSPISTCSGPPRGVGLRHPDDDAVLVCKAHYGRLRKLDARTLRKLHRHLSRTFEKSQAAPARDEETGVLVV